MTESSFPFETTGEEPEATGGGDRRKVALVAGAGALAVAVLGYFVVVPMLSGSSDDSPVASVVHRHVVTKKATTPAKPVAKPLPQPASYADVYARQDPFKSLVAEPVAAPVVPAAPVPPAGTTTGTGTTGTTSGTGSTAGGSSASVGGQRVALVHVFTKDGKQFAQTKVGDKVFTPAVGGVFAGSYKLLATSGSTATYLFGDEQFSLSEGQEVLK